MGASAGPRRAALQRDSADVDYETMGRARDVAALAGALGFAFAGACSGHAVEDVGSQSPSGSGGSAQAGATGGFGRGGSSGTGGSGTGGGFGTGGAFGSGGIAGTCGGCTAGETVGCECNVADGGILTGQATCLAGGGVGVGACTCANGSTSCTPGEFITCMCPADCVSCGAVCLADGSGMTTCTCFGGGTASGSCCTPPSCAGCGSGFDFCVCVTGGAASCATGGAGGAPNDCTLALQGDGQCVSCECNLCPTEAYDCGQDAGCQAINGCMQKVGCRGIACYQPSTCKSVIDAYGGPTGASASLALALSSCAAGGGCPCSG